MNSKIRKIWTRVFRLPIAGLNHHTIRGHINELHHTNPVIKVAIKSCVLKFKTQRAQLRFWKSKFALRRNQKNLRTCAFQPNMPNFAYTASTYSSLLVLLWLKISAGTAIYVHANKTLKGSPKNVLKIRLYFRFTSSRYICTRRALKGPQGRYSYI